MGDLNDFSKRIGKYAQAAQDNTSKVVRATALAVDAVVVPRTPVDSGRARSNWLVEIDRPAEGVVESYGENAAQASMNAAAGRVAQFDATRHTEVHITNNLPYINALNDGSSQQAPANFVEESIMAGVRQVRSSKLLQGV